MICDVPDTHGAISLTLFVSCGLRYGQAQQMVQKNSDECRLEALCANSAFTSRPKFSYKEEFVVMYTNACTVYVYIHEPQYVSVEECACSLEQSYT